VASENLQKSAPFDPRIHLPIIARFRDITGCNRASVNQCLRDLEPLILCFLPCFSLISNQCLTAGQQ
jgi:hypothetical protein